MLMLADGTFFPPWSLNVVLWGRDSGPVGLTPEALQERECSCRGFFARPSSVRGVYSNRHRQCSSQPRCTTRTCLVSPAFGAP
jgi:hypothetical protein